MRKGLSAGRVQSVPPASSATRNGDKGLRTRRVLDLSVKLRDVAGKKSFEAKYYGEDGKKHDLHTEAETNAVLERIKSGLFVITDVKDGVKTRHPAPPFTTSSLQQEASRKLGFTTKRTMMIAQQLYEGIELGSKGAVGLISYIRTDSVRVASEAQTALARSLKNASARTPSPKSRTFTKAVPARRTRTRPSARRASIWSPPASRIP